MLAAIVNTIVYRKSTMFWYIANKSVWMKLACPRFVLIAYTVFYCYSWCIFDDFVDPLTGIFVMFFDPVLSIKNNYIGWSLYV